MTKLQVLFTVSMLAASFAVAGCHVEGPGSSSTSCSGSADAFSCTTDVCDATSMHFVSIPVDANCGSGRFCRPADPAHDAAGCVGTPPPTCTMSCDDGIACTRDFCAEATCQHAADSSLCASGQVCDATSGCEGSGPGPTPDGFRCVFTDGAHRIGYAVRVRASSMTGVRTVPSNTGETMPMSSSMVRLWALGSSDGSVGGGGIDPGSDGCTTYSLVGTAGGGINTHPFITRWRYGAPEFNRDILNVADLRPFAGRSCDDVGIDVQVCMSPSGCTSSSSSWVDLPSRFCTIASDTVGRRFWADDPVLDASIRGSIAERAVIWTNGSDDTASCVPAP